MKFPTFVSGLHLDYGCLEPTSRSWSTLYSYTGAMDQWSMDKEEGLYVDRKYVQAVVNYYGISGNNKTYQVVTREIFDGGTEPVSVQREIIEPMAWGDVVVERIQDPGGLNLSTKMTYYTNASQQGSFGKLRSVENPDGSWEVYEYDSEGRTLGERRSWLDSSFDAPASQTLAITYDYTPVAGGDQLLEYDTRPRTVTESINGIVTGRTYHAYLTEGGERLEITEKAYSQTAGYGDAGNSRSIRAFYPDGSDEVKAGRLKYEQEENGVRMTYDYAFEGSSFVQTETQGTVSSPGGIADKSLRHVKVRDGYGSLVSESTYYYDGQDYQRIKLVESAYNQQQRRVLREKVEGTYRRQLWAGEYRYGELVKTTSGDGVVTEYVYDLLGRTELEIKASPPSHGTYPAQPDIITSYARDLGAIGCGCDSKTSWTVEAGSLVLEYLKEADKAGRITKEVLPGGYTTTYGYADGGRTVTQTNPDLSTVVTANYRDGRLKSVTGSGVVPQYHTYTVNGNGDVTHEIRYGSSGSPRWEKTTHDMLGRVIKIERPAYSGGTLETVYTYNNPGHLVKMQQPGLADQLFEYDALGNLTLSGLDLDDSGTLAAVSADRLNETEWAYETINGAIWRVGRTYVYPEANSANRVKVSESRTRQTGFTGNVASETVMIDTHGNENGRRVEIDPSAALATTTSTSAASVLEAVSVSYNGLLMEQSSFTVAEPVRFTYDALGRRTGAKEPRHGAYSEITYAEDSSLVVGEKDAAGFVTEYIYYEPGETGAGQAASVTRSEGGTSYLEYDLRGNHIRQWGSGDYPVMKTFNTYNELTELRTYRGGSGWEDFTWPASPGTADVTTWVYQESTGLLTRKEYPDTEGADYTYGFANRLATRTWARGVVTTYSYDSDTGELTTVSYSDSTPAVSYTYDRLGRPDTVTDATGTRTMVYNNTLQQESEELDGTFYGGRILEMLYEDGTGLSGRPAGFQVGVTADPDRDYATDWGYGSTGRWETVSASFLAAVTVSYSYEANSDLVSGMSFTSSSVEFARTTYGYGTNRNVKTDVRNQVETGSGWSDVSRYQYRYDGDRRRTDVVNTGSAFTQNALSLWSYNSRSEVIGQTRHLGTNPESPGGLVTDQNFGYDYDNIGNRLTSLTEAGGVNEATRNYTSNALNQYTSITNPSASPVFDEDGNMTYDGVKWYYAWDGENRLIEARSYETTPSNGDERLSFVYDYIGRRVAKTVEHFDGSVWTTGDSRKFLYQGWNLLLEIDRDSGDVLKVYLWGMDLSGTLQGAGGVGGLLGMVDAVEESAMIVFYDANGNVTQLYDWDAEEVVAHYEYDPFGGIVNVYGDYAQNNVFRFSTKYLDVETGLYYYGYRYYDLVTGRWLNRDPIEEDGGLHLYCFVTNSAIDLWDFLGLEKVVPFLFVSYYTESCFPIISISLKAPNRAWEGVSNAVSYASLIAGLMGTIYRTDVVDIVVPECYVLKRDAKGNPAEDTSYDIISMRLGSDGFGVDVCGSVVETMEWFWVPDPDDKCCK